MSYAIYKTEAIILRTIPNGEANANSVFLTRELGKITARVQAARKMESKMRMHLARFGHVAIDVVRGKNVWRLTGISDFKKHKTFSDHESLAAFARAAGLVEHLIRGEESNAELFDFFAGVLDYLDEGVALPPLPRGGAEALRGGGVSESLELFLVIHILAKLGYWSGKPLPEIPTDETLQKLSANKKELVAQINESIEATMIY